MCVPPKTENAVRKMIDKARQSSTIWNRLIQLTEGSLTLHKTPWRLLAYEVLNGDLKVIATMDETMVTEGGLDRYTAIEFVDPGQPNKGLGYHICPDRNQEHVHQAIMLAVNKVCGNINSAYPTEQKAR